MVKSNDFDKIIGAEKSFTQDIGLGKVHLHTAGYQWRAMFEHGYKPSSSMKGVKFRDYLSVEKLYYIFSRIHLYLAK